MKYPGIIDGVLAAGIIAVGTGIAALAFGGFTSLGALLNLVLPWAALAYLVYLFKRSDARTGRVVAIAAWAVVSLACWLFDAHVSQQALAQAGIIWLVRSLYFHNSMLAALLDLGLVAAGLVAGAWALLNTGSAAAALWSFFLLQALFCWVPAFVPGRAETRRDGGESASFQAAHRVAVDAVRKLSQP
jgi:hypothetical protein